jgi:glyoxylase-like metal-dependent hydrolase (beta-lactamase superfamily II)
MAIAHTTLALGPFDTNTYVLVCAATRDTAVIDVGFEPEAVVELLRERGLTPRLLLNTHAHYDHVAGMRALQEELGGEYWLHPGDRPLLEHLGEQGAMFGLPPAAPPPVVHDLADGQRIALGQETLEVIHTPGHSPGGVTFRCGDDLWVGDTLFEGSIGRTDLPGGSFETLERSIRTRLFPLGDGLHVLPGHGPPTTIGRERAHNPFVGERARLA